MRNAAPRIGFILFLALCATAGRAQTPAAGFRVTAPLRVAAQHLFVDLEDEKLGKLSFMVDTGSETTILTAKAAASAQIDHHLTDRFYSLYGFGSGARAKLKGHLQLHLRTAGIELATLKALVLNKDELSLKGMPPADGLLGWDFFQHQCVRLDARAGIMEVSDPEHCAPREEGFYTPHVEWMKEGLLLPMTATLASQKTVALTLHVDTGANSIVLNPRLREALQMEKNPQKETGNQGSGINGSYSFDIAKAVRLEAEGGHPGLQGEIPMIVPRGGYSQPSWLLAGRDEARLARCGSLGNSVLGSYILIFDGKEKKLYEKAYKSREQ
jgi:hypothetical protein